jgi:hypothetical protein
MSRSLAASLHVLSRSRPLDLEAVVALLAPAYGADTVAFAVRDAVGPTCFDACDLDVAVDAPRLDAARADLIAAGYADLLPPS